MKLYTYRDDRNGGRSGLLARMRLDAMLDRGQFAATRDAVLSPLFLGLPGVPAMRLSEFGLAGATCADAPRRIDWRDGGESLVAS